MAESLAQLIAAYRWDESVLRWRAPNGRLVKDSAVKAGSLAFVDRMADDVRALAAQVATGAIPIDEWQRQTAQKVKAAHIAATALARGGFDALTQADYGRIGQRLRGQYERLAGFAAQVAARQLTRKAIAARAQLYARGASAVYEAEVYRGWVGKATTGTAVQTRNVLGAAEHCDGCLGETARGWVPLGSLSLPGSRDCKANDRCHLVYRVRPDPS